MGPIGVSHLREAKAADPSAAAGQTLPPGNPAEAEKQAVTSASPSARAAEASTFAVRIPHFSTRAWLSIVLGIGSALHYSALRTGFLLDDFIHISMMRGNFPAPRHPLDLYNFVDDGDRAEMIARGILPWWTHPDLTIRFFRPLSSALIWLDHQLFGPSPFVMHLHSLAWWAAMVIAAFVLYRTFFGERVARIATFVFALAPCHAMPMAWLANRDALISLGLGIPALFVYTRSRESRALRDVMGAFALFSLAFLGGEYTLSFVAYVATFELVRARDTIMQRIVGMLPFVIPCVVYMAVRTSMHYGTIGSGYYNDPFHAPELFLFFAPRRLATLILEAWLALDNDSINWMIPWPIVLGGAAAVLFIVVRVVRFVLRESEAGPRRAAAWLGIGSVVAMIPVLAVVPGQRVLGAAMFGIAPVLGLMLEGAWFPRTTEPRRGMAELTQMTALALGFAHLVHGPVTTLLLDGHFRDSSDTYTRQMASLRARLGDASTADPVIVRGTGIAFFAPFGIDENGVLPRRFAVLAWASHVLVIRTGERSFDMFAPADGGLFPWGEGNLYLDAAWALRAGDVFHAPGYTVTISEMQEGRTTGAHFDMDDDFSARVWLNETPKAYFEEPLPVEGSGRPYETDH